MNLIKCAVLASIVSTSVLLAESKPSFEPLFISIPANMTMEMRDELVNDNYDLNYQKINKVEFDLVSRLIYNDQADKVKIDCGISENNEGELEYHSGKIYIQRKDRSKDTKFRFSSPSTCHQFVGGLLTVGSGYAVAEWSKGTVATFADDYFFDLVQETIIEGDTDLFIPYNVEEDLKNKSDNFIENSPVAKQLKKENDLFIGELLRELPEKLKSIKKDKFYFPKKGMWTKQYQQKW